MINMFKKPKVTIYKDEDGKFKYMAYGQDVEVEFKEIKNTEMKERTIEKNVDSTDLEKRIKNLEELIYGDGEVTLYRDDGNTPIVKRGVPERPTIFPDVDEHRWG